MKNVIGAGFAILALAYAIVLPAEAQEPARSQVEVDYKMPSKPYQQIREGLKKYQVLERMARFLSPLKLPGNQKILLQFDECGAESRAYKGDGVVTICYELQQKIEIIALRTPKQQTQEAIQRLITTLPFNEQQRDFVVRFGTLIQIGLHEVAVAVFDILKVPLWGQREDAADRLAAFLMVQFSEEVALMTIAGTAMFFELSEKTYPDARRYYNYLCIAFGGRPQTFEFLVTKKILPEDRAAYCFHKEYAQVRKAFNLRIMPYVDPDRLVQVRSMQSLVAGIGP